jgi:N-acetylglutamate synthase-like GNAT family acetyltransferase
MIRIRVAKRFDLPAIRELMQTHGKNSVEEYHINNRDISLVAEMDGKLVGFVWCGLMAQNKFAYVDKVSVHPDYQKKGVTNKLYWALGKRMVRAGVKQAFGIIRHDEWHTAAAVNALKMGFGSDGYNYTYVLADIGHAKAEIGLEA